VLHERFAGWLEGSLGERIAEYEAILGYHLEQAYRYRSELGLVDDDTRALGERAAGFLAAAGRRALERSDDHAAVTLLERALAIGLAEPRERVLRQLELVSGLTGVGRYSEREPLVAEALATATRIGDRALAARVRVGGVDLTLWEADADLAAHQRVLEEAMETLEELGDEIGLLKGLRTYGQSLAIQGRPDERLATSERALAMAEACGERYIAREVSFSIAYGIATSGHIDDAVRRCEELRHANRDDRVYEALIGRCLARCVAMAGDARKARSLVEQAERVLAEFNPTLLYPYVVGLDAAAGALMYAGDRAGAKRLHRVNSLKRSEGRERPDGRAVRAAIELALLCCEDGEWDEVERCLAAGEGDSGSQSAVRLAVQARVAAHHGRHTEASALAARAVERAERRDNPNLQARMWANVAAVRRAGGNEEGADEATARAVELFDRVGNVGGVAMVRPVVSARV
jgi:tetratricopeptide (TPR) repeat protein